MHYINTLDALKDIANTGMAQRKEVGSAVEIARYLNRLAVEAYLIASGESFSIVNKRIGPMGLSPVDPMKIKPHKNDKEKVACDDPFIRPRIIFDIKTPILKATSDTRPDIPSFGKPASTMLWRKSNQPTDPSHGSSIGVSEVKETLNEISMVIVTYLMTHRDLSPGEIYVLDLSDSEISLMRESRKSIRTITESLTEVFLSEGINLTISEEVFMEQVKEIIHGATSKSQITSHSRIMAM